MWARCDVLLEGSYRSVDTVFGADALAECGDAAPDARVSCGGTDRRSEALGGERALRDRLWAGAKLGDARTPERLIRADRGSDGRDAGAQAGGCRASSAVVHDGRHTGK